MTKNHSTLFNDMDSSDGYNCKVQLTESKKHIVLTAMFLSDVYAFPLFSETWTYDKDEAGRAIKTFNRCVNIVEDMKVEYEDEELPGPTLQGLAREALRYIDIDRKKDTPSRSLEAAKYLDGGVADWRSSIYGNRMPGQNSHSINITNHGTINFS